MQHLTKSGKLSLLTNKSFNEPVLNYIHHLHCYCAILNLFHTVDKLGVGLLVVLI